MAKMLSVRPEILRAPVFLREPLVLGREEIVWPPATDLKQLGQDQPLAVFEREFLIGVQLAIPASAPPGALKVPGHLRYQACDANLCYAPATADFEWAINVVPGTPATIRPSPASRACSAEMPTTPRVTARMASAVV